MPHAAHGDPAAAGAASDARGESEAVAPSLLLLLAALLALLPLSTDLYLSSLPELARVFDATPARVQLTLSVFSGGFAIAQLLCGPLSDRFGRRPVVLGGCALYLGGSVLAALAPALDVLIAGRLVQSVGVCCTVVCARAIVRDRYAPEPGARVLSRATSWLSLAILAGPLAGSLLFDAFGWRACFVALSAIAAAVLIVAAWRLPETNRHRDPNATRLAPLARNYATMLRSPTFLAFTLAVSGSYCCLFSFISSSSFVLIQLLGVPVRWYGACFAIVTIGFMTGTLAMRRLLPRLGLHRTVTAGSSAVLAGGALLAVLAATGVQTVAAIVVPMFVVLFGHGLVQPAAQMGAAAPFAKNAGAAAALAGFTMNFFASFVAWGIGALHDGTTRPFAFTVAAIALATFAVALGWVPGLAHERELAGDPRP